MTRCSDNTPVSSVAISKYQSKKLTHLCQPMLNQWLICFIRASWNLFRLEQLEVSREGHLNLKFYITLSRPFSMIKSALSDETGTLESSRDTRSYPGPIVDRPFRTENEHLTQMIASLKQLNTALQYMAWRSFQNFSSFFFLYLAEVDRSASLTTAVSERDSTLTGFLMVGGRSRSVAIEDSFHYLNSLKVASGMMSSQNQLSSSSSSSQFLRILSSYLAVGLIFWFNFLSKSCLLGLNGTVLRVFRKESISASVSLLNLQLLCSQKQGRNQALILSFRQISRVSSLMMYSSAFFCMYSAVYLRLCISLVSSIISISSIQSSLVRMFISMSSMLTAGDSKDSSQVEVLLMCKDSKLLLHELRVSSRSGPYLMKALNRTVQSEIECLSDVYFPVVLYRKLASLLEEIIASCAFQRLNPIWDLLNRTFFSSCQNYFSSWFFLCQQFSLVILDAFSFLSRHLSQMFSRSFIILVCSSMIFMKGWSQSPQDLTLSLRGQVNLCQLMITMGPDGVSVTESVWLYKLGLDPQITVCYAFYSSDLFSSDLAIRVLSRVLPWTSSLGMYWISLMISPHF